MIYNAKRPRFFMSLPEMTLFFRHRRWGEHPNFLAKHNTSQFLQRRPGIRMDRDEFKSAHGQHQVRYEENPC